MREPVTGRGRRSAARRPLERRAERVAVLDLDVHQGNGTAAIFAGDADVFTFSMHGEKNFPARKAVSDRDVGLPCGVGDDDYLARLSVELPAVLAAARAELVFYLAGVDPARGPGATATGREES